MGMSVDTVTVRVEKTAAAVGNRNNSAFVPLLIYSVYRVSHLFSTYPFQTKPSKNITQGSSWINCSMICKEWPFFGDAVWRENNLENSFEQQNEYHALHSHQTFYLTTVCVCDYELFIYDAFSIRYLNVVSFIYSGSSGRKGGWMAKEFNAL
jgi:hypothetical protein